MEKKYITLNDSAPITNVMASAEAQKEKIKAAKGAVMCLVAMIITNPMYAAAAEDLQKNIETALKKIQEALVAISTPLYGVIAVVCLILMVAGSGRKAEAGKDWLIRASIAYAAILAVSGIVAFIGGIAK